MRRLVFLIGLTIGMALALQGTPRADAFTSPMCVRAPCFAPPLAAPATNDAPQANVARNKHQASTTQANPLPTATPPSVMSVVKRPPTPVAWWALRRLERMELWLSN